MLQQTKVEAGAEGMLHQKVVLTLGLTAVILSEESRHLRLCAINDERAIRHKHGDQVAHAVALLAEGGVSIGNDDYVIFGRVGSKTLQNAILVLSDDTIHTLITLRQLPENGGVGTIISRGHTKILHIHGQLRSHLYLTPHRW